MTANDPHHRAAASDGEFRKRTRPPLRVHVIVMCFLE